LVAQRLADVAELLAQRTNEVEAEDPDPGYMMITGFQRTTAEVAAAMNLSPMAAGFVVSHADALHSRLPQVAALFTAGVTDWRTAVDHHPHRARRRLGNRTRGLAVGESDLFVALLVT
jgi:Domain of unknown function (DUF222)